jgi:DNA-cytosine methyltransferase
MKILSLFDGISCGRLALERAGLTVSRYVAYEIDAHAIAVSNWNWPDIEQKGSVEGADFTQYRGFDMVIGGFPCTDLSIGKNNREGLEGKHSRLFWEQVRAIKEVKPRYFFVENNYRMPKEAEAVITETLGVSPVYINSALVSAQNRERLYWTNIPDVTAPEDRGIKLADILESRPALKYYHTEGALDYLTRSEMNGRFLSRLQTGQIKNNTLTSSYSKGVPYNVLAVAYGTALRSWPRSTKEGRYKRPEVRLDGKANALTTVTTDNMVTYPVGDDVPFFEVLGGFMQYKDRKVPVKLEDGLYTIRKLTPVECERLQTLPDGYTEMVSDTQRYNQLGNGWNVDTIAHIFNHIHLDELL